MTNSLYLFSAATNTWELLDPSGGPPPRVESLAVVRLDDNRILFLGGKTSESASARTFIYNLPQNKWVFTESQDLPVGTNSLAAIRFVQSDVSTACGSAGSDLSGMKLCTPITKPVIVAYGGSQQCIVRRHK
ncbi:hypothetical protein BC832DRAFT_12755 [Gaertneriomyces semiglobifer]|nr:hypothetical protein BC832DRAFT_12755 [Gaertneriomyces semiglobifer]